MENPYDLAHTTQVNSMLSLWDPQKENHIWRANVYFSLMESPYHKPFMGKNIRSDDKKEDIYETEAKGRETKKDS